MTSFTQAQLDSLEAAIASGKLSWQHDGSAITYRSMDDMIRARDMIKNEITPAASRPAGPRHSVARFDD